MRKKSRARACSQSNPECTRVPKRFLLAMEEDLWGFGLELEPRTVLVLFLLLVLLLLAVCVLRLRKQRDSVVSRVQELEEYISKSEFSRMTENFRPEKRECVEAHSDWHCERNRKRREAPLESILDYCGSDLDKFFVFYGVVRQDSPQNPPRIRSPRRIRPPSPSFSPKRRPSFYKKLYNT